MENEKIQQLMQLMENFSMKRLHIKDENNKIEIDLERSDGSVHHVEPKQVFVSSPVPAQQVQSTPVPAENEEEKFVKSPIVGTFYTAASSNDPPFVKVGDTINAESVVCIVEAMKVMNEIKAQVVGKIVEILVKNGEPVEYGTKLVKII